MNKKIIGIIAIAIIIIGIVVTAILDINSDLIYKAHKELDINIGKQFDNKEIEDIVKEATGASKVMVSKVELYEDMANIKIEDATEEQIAQINSKINEKYSLENKTEDIVITDVPKVKAFDLIKPYILPTIIAFIFVEVYLVTYLVIYKKTSKESVEINIPKSMLELFIATIGVQLVYASIISITRFPANEFIIPISIVLFIITTMVKFIKK